MENFPKIEKDPSEKIGHLIESSLAHGFKFDEGQNAIVLEVNPEDLDDDVRDDFFADQAEAREKDPFVSKVLRVFSAGHSQEEADNQIQAQTIISQASLEKQSQMAKVPELYFHQDIEIKDEALKEKLRKSGVEMTSNEVGALLMYKVKGVDFLNYLLQEAIKKLPPEEAKKRPNIAIAQEALSQDRQAMSTEEVFKVAAALVGFEESQRVQLSSVNRDRLFAYLKSQDFVLDQAILNKIETTIEYLNQNGFYHNDLTERNMMLEFGEKGEITDVYLIDFEKAADQRDEEFGGEMAILGEYRPLTEGKEARQEKELEHFFTSIEKLKLRVIKGKPVEYKSLKDRVRSMLKAKNEGDMSLAEKIALSEANQLLGDKAYELLAAIILELSQKNSAAAKKYIAQRTKDKSLSVRYVNYLSRINSRI
jgi:tRNA A-37 threonylcarbamoyl transferase component Bud32